jgi:hypothetical protein
LDPNPLLVSKSPVIAQNSAETMENDRITSLEQNLARIEGQLGNTSDQLADLLAFMKLQKETKETPETPKVPTPETGVGPKPATGDRQLRIPKLASPPDYDGDRQKGVAFLNACQMYIWLRPTDFPEEQMKIVWAMSYMKTGRAQKWTAQIFRWEALPENAGLVHFLDWTDF